MADVPSPGSAASIKKEVPSTSSAPPNNSIQHGDPTSAPSALHLVNMGNGATPGSNTGAANTPRAESNTPAAQVRPGGAPARVYMNEKIVPYLLEGMKSVVKEQPSDPLRMLGEFLIQKSNEVEGGAVSTKKSPE